MVHGKWRHYVTGLPAINQHKTFLLTRNIFEIVQTIQRKKR